MRATSKPCKAKEGADDGPHVEIDPATVAAREEARERRMTWAQLLLRAFRCDVLECDNCGGRRELLALIPAGEIATKILAHLKLPTEPPKFGRARPPPDAEAQLDWCA